MTRRRLAAAVGLGVALYGVALYLIVTADLGEPRALIAMVTVAGLIFTVTGVVAALRRPDNRTGAQMLAVGLLWSLGALQLASGSLLFTLGYVLGGVAFVAFAHLILSYPTGRLRPRDEWIVWAVLALVTVGPFVVTLVDPSPVPGCDDCPESAFLVADRSGLAQMVNVAVALGAAALSAFVFMRLVKRYQEATPPLRRVIGPVYLFTLIALVGLVASSLVGTFDADAGYAIEFAALASLALMPVAFLAGILRTRLARAGIADLVIALGNGSPLRDALGDGARRPVAGPGLLVRAASGVGRRRGPDALRADRAGAGTLRRSSSTAASASQRSSTTGASPTSASSWTPWRRRPRSPSRRSACRPSSARSTASSRRSSTPPRASSRWSTPRAGSATSTARSRSRAGSTTAPESRGGTSGRSSSTPTSGRR